MCFIQSCINFSLFYIFYAPDYICVDRDFSNPKPCSKARACAPGQNYILDDSKPDKRSRAWAICWAWAAALR